MPICILLYLIFSCDIYMALDHKKVRLCSVSTCNTLRAVNTERGVINRQALVEAKQVYNVEIKENTKTSR